MIKKSKNQKSKHTAREAAFTGFSFIGKSIFLLDENENIRLDEFKEFLKKYQNKTVILFGLTHVVWEILKKLDTKKINLKNSILIHGGGWKKIEDENANKKNFNSIIKSRFNITNIHDYYGMVEQTGSIF